MNKICLFSIDVEEDITERGETIPQFFGLEQLSSIYPILEKHAIPSTLFATGEAITRYPQVLRVGKQFGHEIALHGFYDHINIQEQTVDACRIALQKHVAIFEQTFGESPHGFRAVQNTMDEARMDLLREMGFLYDSSIISRYPPFKSYIGYRESAPRTPYVPSVKNMCKRDPYSSTSMFVEVPLSPLVLGIQLQGRWIQRLGVSTIKRLLGIYKPALLSFSFHSWDLRIDTQDSRCGDSFLRAVDELLSYLVARGYVFHTAGNIASSYVKRIRAN